MSKNIKKKFCKYYLVRDGYLRTSANKPVFHVQLNKAKNLQVINWLKGNLNLKTELKREQEKSANNEIHTSKHASPGIHGETSVIRSSPQASSSSPQVYQNAFGQEENAERRQTRPSQALDQQPEVINNSAAAGQPQQQLEVINEGNNIQATSDQSLEQPVVTHAQNQVTPDQRQQQQNLITPEQLLQQPQEMNQNIVNNNTPNLITPIQARPVQNMSLGESYVAEHPNLNRPDFDLTFHSADDNLDLQVNTTDPRIAQLQSELENARQLANITDPRIGQLEAELENARQLANITDPRIGQLEVELEKAQKIANTTDPRIGQLQAELESARDLANTTDPRIAQLQAELEKAQELANKTDPRIAPLQAELESARELANKTDPRIAQLQSELQNAQQEKIKSQSAIEDMQNKLDDALRVQLDSNSKIDTYRNELIKSKKAENTILDYKKAAKLQQEILNVKEKLIDVQNEEIKNLQNIRREQLNKLKKVARPSVQESGVQTSLSPISSKFGQLAVEHFNNPSGFRFQSTPVKASNNSLDLSSIKNDDSSIAYFSPEKDNSTLPPHERVLNSSNSISEMDISREQSNNAEINNEKNLETPSTSNSLVSLEKVDIPLGQSSRQSLLLSKDPLASVLSNVTQTKSGNSLGAGQVLLSNDPLAFTLQQEKSAIMPGLPASEQSTLQLSKNYPTLINSSNENTLVASTHKVDTPVEPVTKDSLQESVPGLASMTRSNFYSNNNRIDPLQIPADRLNKDSSILENYTGQDWTIHQQPQQYPRQRYENVSPDKSVHASQLQSTQINNAPAIPFTTNLSAISDVNSGDKSLENTIQFKPAVPQASEVIPDTTNLPLVSNNESTLVPPIPQHYPRQRYQNVTPDKSVHGSQLQSTQINNAPAIPFTTNLSAISDANSSDKSLENTIQFMTKQPVVPQVDVIIPDTTNFRSGDLSLLSNDESTLVPPNSADKDSSVNDSIVEYATPFKLRGATFNHKPIEADLAKFTEIPKLRDLAMRQIKEHQLEEELDRLKALDQFQQLLPKKNFHGKRSRPEESSLTPVRKRREMSSTFKKSVPWLGKNTGLYGRDGKKVSNLKTENKSDVKESKELLETLAKFSKNKTRNE